MPARLSKGSKTKTTMLKMPEELSGEVAALATKRGYTSTSAFIRALLQKAVDRSNGAAPTRKVIAEDKESGAAIAARIKQMAIDELTPKKLERIFPDEDGWDDDPKPKPGHPWHPLFGKQCKRCGRYHDEEGICGCESVSTW
jgi:Arc/MetJ-type ribon-helix-helix transcriptional regulator